jgi:AraC family transcriptional regulator of arabinose operon
MSKATTAQVGANAPPATSWPACRCFFVNPGGADRAHDLPVHRHSFWQLELGTAGRFPARLGTETIEVRPGLAVFIPPGLRHGFSYLPGIGYLSFKFHTEEGPLPPRSLDLRSSPLLAALEQALVAAVTESPRRPEVLDALLSALLAACRPVPEEPGVGAGLAQRVAELVRSRRGAPVSVRQAAAELGYSPGHLSALVRRETGRPLKELIDRERGRRAAELVRYSDAGFKQLAEELGFPDQFSFSRFFKRVHGRSPRAFRARAGQGQDL